MSQEKEKQAVVLQSPYMSKRDYASHSFEALTGRVLLMRYNMNVGHLWQAVVVLKAWVVAKKPRLFVWDDSDHTGVIVEDLRVSVKEHAFKKLKMDQHTGVIVEDLGVSVSKQNEEQKMDQ